MPALSIADLVKGTGGTLAAGSGQGTVTGVSIDSRTCAPGEAFFAIRGHHRDGHAFVADARARGVSAVVVMRGPDGLQLPADFPVIVVDDTTAALQRLAAYHRRRLGLAVVAITGSNGKTTTKELTAAVLARRFQVLKAAGSFNNQWGLPLTLLSLEPTHEAAVLELGMNAFGEIAALARLAQPSVGVVTLIAPAHLEGVGSLDGVQKAKGELVQAIPPDGVVVLNADDPLVLALARDARARVVTYGQAPTADVRLADVNARGDAIAFTVSARGAAATVHVPLAGRHNAWNATAALAVGLALGVPLPAAVEALADAHPLKGRLAWREAGGVRILDDTYNANPVSLRAALEALRVGGAGGRMWVVFGDMLELGPVSEAAHDDAGRWIAGLPAAGLATTGTASRRTAETARAAGCPEVATFATPEEAAAHAAARAVPGDRVLVKGSRGMRMERAVETLLGRLAAATGGRAC
jgi:UDP-N-acetylmuramoyl-tripeptide--D-alanyl-D-alanine ligase